jgi:hypothetical protein
MNVILALYLQIFFMSLDNHLAGDPFNIMAIHKDGHLVDLLSFVSRVPYSSE